MILDSLKSAENYYVVNRYFTMAFDFLKQNDLQNMESGRYEIEGKNVFAMISENELKPEEAAALEAHDKYIDIQMIIEGIESFGWNDRTTCSTPKGEMDQEKDILFFDDEPSTYLTVNEGEFVVFFPADAHAPLIGEGKAKKCVVKVRV